MGPLGIDNRLSQSLKGEHFLKYRHRQHNDRGGKKFKINN